MFTMLNNTPLNRLMMLGAAGAGKAVEDTATGNPLTFLTDLAKPLKSLLIPFTPKQTGSGDPSPSNIRPIVPWEGLSVWNSGKNLAKLTYGTKVPSINTGQMVTGNGWSSDFIRIDKTKNYYCSGTASLGNVYALYYGADYSYLGNRSHNTSGFSLNSDSYFSSATYVKLRNDSNSSKVLNIQLEEGQTATAYEEAHITETDISFASPVYGGTLDAVTGVLTVEWVMASFKRTVFGAVQEGALDYRQYTDSTLPVAKTDGSSWYNARREQKSNICVIANPYSETSFGNLIGVVFSIDAFQKKPTFRISDALYQSLTDTDDIEFVYELATPQEITLTPQQITALVGNNTIWSDADGSMTAVYFKKG